MGLWSFCILCGYGDDSILIDLSQYLGMEVADSVTKKVLSLQILKTYKNCISVDSSLS